MLASGVVLVVVVVVLVLFVRLVEAELNCELIPEFELELGLCDDL